MNHRSRKELVKSINELLKVMMYYDLTLVERLAKTLAKENRP